MVPCILYFDLPLLLLYKVQCIIDNSKNTYLIAGLPQTAARQCDECEYRGRDHTICRRDVHTCHLLYHQHVHQAFCYPT